MKIGEKFTFLSNGKHRKAIFLEQNKNKIIGIICDEKMQGVKVEIFQKQIIN